MKFCYNNTCVLSTGEPVYNALTVDKNALQMAEFCAKIQRPHAPLFHVGFVELILLENDNVAICKVKKTTNYAKELLFPILTGSEIVRVNRHGNCISLVSGNAVLTLESDSKLMDGAPILASQWCRILTRLAENSAMRRDTSTRFAGLGISVPTAAAPEPFQYNSTNPNNRRFKQLVPQPEPRPIKSAIPASKTMNRISLCLQKTTDLGVSGFGEDLKSLLNTLDENEEKEKEVKEEEEGENFQVPEAPFSIANMTPQEEFLSLDEDSNTPSPSKVHLDLDESNENEQEQEFKRVESIFRKESEMRKNGFSSTQHHNSEKRPANNVLSRNPPNIPPPSLRAQTQLDLREPAKLNVKTVGGNSTPTRSTSTNERRVLFPVNENVSKASKSPRIVNSMKKLFSKRKDHQHHSGGAGGNSGAPDTPVSPNFPELAPEPVAAKPTASAIPCAVSSSGSKNRTSAVPKLNSTNSISSLSFRSLSSRSLAQYNTKSPSPEDAIKPVPSSFNAKTDLEDDSTWFDLEEKLRAEADTQESSPTLLHRENGHNFQDSPIILDPETIEFEGGEVEKKRANSTTKEHKDRDLKDKVDHQDKDDHSKNVPFALNNNKSMPALATDRKPIPNSSSVSSYSSFGSRKSELSDGTLSSSSSFSTPSLSLSFKKMTEMTIFACKLWVSKWNGTRWIPLSQLELGTEITYSDNNVRVSIQVPGQQENVDVNITPKCEVRKISLHDVELKSLDGVFMFRGRDMENSQRIFRTLWTIIVYGVTTIISEDRNSVRHSIINDKRKTLLPPTLSKSNQNLRYPGILTSTIIEE